MVTIRSRSGGRNALSLFAEPRYGAPDAFLERCTCLEAEQRCRLRRVERASWWPVRHRGVPPDLAGEPGGGCDNRCSFADRRLDPGAQVYRVRLVVVLRCQDQPFVAVVDVEILPGRCPVSPQHDLLWGV